MKKAALAMFLAFLCQEAFGLSFFLKAKIKNASSSPVTICAHEKCQAIGIGDEEIVVWGSGALSVEAAGRLSYYTLPVPEPFAQYKDAKTGLLDMHLSERLEIIACTDAGCPKQQPPGYPVAPHAQPTVQRDGPASGGSVR